MQTILPEIQATCKVSLSQFVNPSMMLYEHRSIVAIVKLK